MTNGVLAERLAACPFLMELPETCQPEINIVGTVASLTESELLW